jgi:hypothetical protein
MFSVQCVGCAPVRRKCISKVLLSEKGDSPSNESIMTFCTLPRTSISKTILPAILPTFHDIIASRSGHLLEIKS